MNKKTKEILRQMQAPDAPLIHVVKAPDAQPLIDRRLVRRVKMSPAPEEGLLAVNLTLTGAAFRIDPPAEDTED